MLRFGKPAIRAAAMLILAALLSGCWDTKDINHRVLPVVMGLSKVDGNYNMFLQIPEPTSDDSKMRIVSDSGETVSDIVDKISMNLESQIDLLHLKVLLIDRKYAEEGINDSITSFIRAQDISPKTMVVICDEPLDRFFDAMSKPDNQESTTLVHFFEKNAGWNPQVAQTRIWQMFRSIHSYTNDTMVPIIRSDDSTVIQSRGSAIIRNGRMVDRITPDDTLMINIFNGHSAQGKIEVMDHANVEIVSNAISHKSRVAGNQTFLECHVRLKVTILETKGEPSVAQVKWELEDLLRKRSEALLAKLQKRKADIVAFGQHFRTKIPRDQLAKWRTDYFPYTDINLQFQVIVQNEGNLKMRKH
ncbi:Ger(x)C family spore germination protein [Paenibacillus nanensis]|uniref:Ger(X)C family spore germination protein n=1 Tax=Paenibacillus nanensis TaxID=393251 RepID=A0A3A1VEN6_9BACL|nr:Ger(x)C family spore germination protein [Paenibacillus nanensis]RIX59379.1 Ger(x)C family spore germination protein [Paenibacillus nanensis]